MELPRFDFELLQAKENFISLVGKRRTGKTYCVQAHIKRYGGAYANIHVFDGSVIDEEYHHLVPRENIQEGFDIAKLTKILENQLARIREKRATQNGENLRMLIVFDQAIKYNDIDEHPALGGLFFNYRQLYITLIVVDNDVRNMMSALRSLVDYTGLFSVRDARSWDVLRTTTLEATDEEVASFNELYKKKAMSAVFVCGSSYSRREPHLSQLQLPENILYEG